MPKSALTASNFLSIKKEKVTDIKEIKKNDNYVNQIPKLSKNLKQKLLYSGRDEVRLSVTIDKGNII